MTNLCKWKDIHQQSDPAEGTLQHSIIDASPESDWRDFCKNDPMMGIQWLPHFQSNRRMVAVHKILGESCKFTWAQNGPWSLQTIQFSTQPHYWDPQEWLSLTLDITISWWFLYVFFISPKVFVAKRRRRAATGGTSAVGALRGCSPTLWEGELHDAAGRPLKTLRSSGYTLGLYDDMCVYIYMYIYINIV